MALMTKGRKKTRDPREAVETTRLSVRAVDEVYDVLAALRGLVRKDRSIALFYEGAHKKVTQDALVQAVLLHLGTIPAAEQREFVREGLAILNQVLERAWAESEAGGAGKNGGPTGGGIAPPTLTGREQSSRSPIKGAGRRGTSGSGRGAG